MKHIVGGVNDTSTQVLHSLGFDFRAAAKGGKPHPNDVRLLGMTATPFKNIKLDKIVVLVMNWV